MKSVKTTPKEKTSIQNIVRPVMQLRAGLDRISTLTLRKQMGFGISHFRILYVLAFKSELSQKDIADYWDVTEASISRQVNILREKGFLETKPSTKLTPKGKKVLDDALKHATFTFELVFKEITEDERKTAAAILEKLSVATRKYLDLFEETAKEIKSEKKFKQKK